LVAVDIAKTETDVRGFLYVHGELHHVRDEENEFELSMFGLLVSNTNCRRSRSAVTNCFHPRLTTGDQHGSRANVAKSLVPTIAVHRIKRIDDYLRKQQGNIINIY
jgi:hypothetical protein